MARRLILVIIILLFEAVPSWADVAALSYTDTGSQVQTVAPSKQYINPVGGIDLYLTGGLDRKVGYVLQDSSGATVAAGVSGLITASNTITVLGQTHYGKILSIPAALAEGSYTLTAQILSSGGSVIATQSYPLVVDRTPPTAGELWWRARPTVLPATSIMNNELVTGYYMCQIWAKDVSDANGIVSVVFQSYDPNGPTVYATKAGWYNAATQEAGLGGATSEQFPAGALPSLDGPLGVRFIITDRAGNQKVAQAVVRFDGTCAPYPELVAVHDPNVTAEYIPGSGLVGYVAYTPGMTVYENPMKLLYRLPRSNWLNDNPDYGLTAYGGTQVYVDSQYAYFVFTVPYSSTGVLNQNFWKFSNPRWFSAGVLTYQLVLASGVPASPVLVSWQVYRSDSGWGPDNASSKEFLSNGTWQVTRVRAVVEPRPYDQVVKTQLGSTPSCTVPAGQTECTMEVPWALPAAGQVTHYSALLKVQNANGTLYTTDQPNLLVLYDLAPPMITSHTLDQAGKTVTFDVIKPFAGATFGKAKLEGGGVRAVNQATSGDVSLSGSMVSLGDNKYRITVSYGALPDGNWQFTLQAWDESQNLATQDIGALVLDATPPAVQFYRQGQVLADHDTVDRLGQVSFTVTDGVDANPVVESVRLTGGPQNTDVYLACRQVNDAYVLEYPVLYPSAGQEYTLTVQARDASGNRRVQSVAWLYAPPTVSLASGGGATLYLPAIPAAAVHKDGSNALLSQPVKIGDQVVSGSYDLVVVSGTDSTVPVVVGGSVVGPGEQMVIAGYDFGAHGGRLDLPVWSEQAGQANILITSLAPEFPVLSVPIRFWQPEVALAADPGWEVQPLVQAQQISAAPAAGTPCALTYDERQAQAADPIDQPVCLVEFTATPPGYQLVDGRLKGVLQAAGPLVVGYTVSLYNGGTKHILASGSRDITRLPITDVSVGVQALPSPVYQKVQELRVQAQSTGKIPCRVTGDQAEAARYGAYETTCLVHWQTVPSGLSADASLPVLTGKLNNAGEQTVSWSVDIYTPAGRAEDVANGSLAITAQELPEPSFTLQPGLHAQMVDDGKLVVLSEGDGMVGSVQFRPPMDNARLTLTVEVDGEAASYEYKSARAITFSRYLKLGSLPVWSVKTLRVMLSYTDMPEKRTEKSYQVTVVPPKRLEALLRADRFGSSTTGLGVSLQVGILTRDGLRYDRAQHGDWEVEFGYIGGVNNYYAMTAREALPASGKLTKMLNPPLGNVTLIAVLSLKPPPAASYYSRTLLSNKAYTVVLKGEAPAGELISNVVSGPAPLVVLPKLKISAKDQRVIGQITWQMSHDNGATWENLKGVQPYMAQLKLAPGQYVVRVELENRLSGAKGYTNQLAFTAYDVPEVTVTGPNAVIVNTPFTMRAELANQGAAVAADEATVQWYRHDREGDTLVHTGPTLTVTPAELGNYQYIVRAALKSAVAADAKAWRQAVKLVRVVPPYPPEIRVIAPDSMEYNTKEAQTYRLQAVASLRGGLDQETYPIEGQWELPDGTVVPGASLSYSPTAADAAKRKSLIVYRAWLKDMKASTTATVVKSIPLTIYDWPAFTISVDQDYAMAPSLVTLAAMPSTGKPWTLEKPQYAWSLPEGATIVRSLDNGRVVQVVFDQAGTHNVTLNVKDARGSTATAVAQVTLTPAPAMEVSFQPVFSNPDKREPLDVLVRARFSGGHPADRITSVTYSTDAPKAAVNQSLGYVQGLPAGSHTITVTATTILGKTVTASLPVEVAANQPPTCTVSSRQDSRYVYLEAACTDPDGRITAYRWYRNGRVVGCSNRLTQSLADAVDPVYFEAIDSNGAKYQELISANSGG